MYLKQLPNGIKLDDVVFWADGPGKDGIIRDRKTKAVRALELGSATPGEQIAGGYSFDNDGDNSISAVTAGNVKTVLQWFYADSDSAMDFFELTSEDVYAYSSSKTIIENSGNGTVYINGVVGSVYGVGIWNLLAVTFPENVAVDGSGAIWYSTANTFYFTGKCGPVILLSKELTATEIGQYYDTHKLYASRFAPTIIPGLQLWLDASDESYVIKNENNIVSAWNDKSGNGYDHGNIDNVLTWTPEGISFASTAAINRTAASPELVTGDGDFTLFIRGNFPDIAGSTAAAPFIYILSTDGVDAAARRPYVYFFKPTRLLVNSYNNTTGSNITQTAGTRTFTIWVNGAGLGHVSDGISTGEQVTDTLTTGQTFVISRLGSLTATDQVWVYKQLLFFNRKLSAPEINQVEAWLDTK